MLVTVLDNFFQLLKLPYMKYEKFEMKVCISLAIPLCGYLCSLNGSAHFLCGIAYLMR